MDEEYTIKQLERIQHNLKMLDKFIEPLIEEDEYMWEIYAYINDSRMRIEGILHKVEE